MALIQLNIVSRGWTNQTSTPMTFNTERMESIEALTAADLAIDGTALSGATRFSYKEDDEDMKIQYSCVETVASILSASQEGTSIALEKALCGDLVLVISPTTKTTAATSSAWTRTVTITLGTAAGEIHDWYNATVTGACSIADTSTAGTATIPNTSLVFVEGVATKVITGSASAWLGAETDTLTVAALSLTRGIVATVTGGTSVETFA